MTSLVDRLRLKIRAYLDDTGTEYQEFSRRMGRAKPWTTQVLKGTQGIRVDALPKLAEAMQTTVAELLREDGELLMALREHERDMVELYQLLPPEQQNALRGLLEFTFKTRRNRLGSGMSWGELMHLLGKKSERKNAG